MMIVDGQPFDDSAQRSLMEFKDFTTVERKPRKDTVGDDAFRHTARKNINRFIYRAFGKPKK